MEGDPEKLKARAERFGIAKEDPVASSEQQAGASKRSKRPEKLRSKPFQQHGGFKTGLDVYAEEELAKRQSRAKRFEIQENVLEYAPLEEDAEEQRKRDRAKRFGTEFQAKDQSGLQNEDILEQRKDQSFAVERRMDTVHLYGVDKLSTKEVLDYFKGFGPQTVEWIDDSCCNIVFADEHSAKRAIVGHGRPFEGANAEDLQGLDASDISNLPYLWHKGPDFVKGNKAQVPLIFRIATVDDRKGMAPSKRPRFLWLNGQPRSRQKRKAAVDLDGDVQMGENFPAKHLSLRAVKRRRRQNGIVGPDSEVVEAEERPADPVKRPARVGVPLPEPKEEMDLAELQAARERQRAEGPSGLFSAAKAGILPSFLLLDGGVEEANIDDPDTSSEQVQEGE